MSTPHTPGPCQCHGDPCIGAGNLRPGYRCQQQGTICDLAECYRLSGADPDGNEDWRLAPLAVAEVRRLRGEYDQQAATLTALREALRSVADDRHACETMKHRALAALQLAGEK